MGDDPLVPLSNGAHLLHVVGVLDPLGRVQRPRGASPPPAPVHWARSADVCHQPHLDAQEDHAAAPPCGLELWREERAPVGGRGGAACGVRQTARQLRGVFPRLGDAITFSFANERWNAL